jgi:hypothetical protein
MMDPRGAPHLDDAGLLAVVDGDAPPAGRTHAEECAVCAGRLRRLTADARAVSALLAEVQLPTGFRTPVLPEVPARRTGFGAPVPAQLRVAAGVLVLLFAFGAPPVRAWMVEQAERWAGEVAGLLGGGGDRAATAAGSADEGSALLLTPAPGTLEVVVERPDGILRLGTTDAPQARVEAVAGGRADELVRTPGGVRIRNLAGPPAEYRVLVPLEVTSVRVRVGDRARSFTAQELRAGVRLDLRELALRAAG